jgi:NAD+ kinase
MKTTPVPSNETDQKGHAAFHRVALIGKYQGGSTANAVGELAAFLAEKGFEVCVERDTAENHGMKGFAVRELRELGTVCDLAIVVGGDGTMLSVGRQMAKFAVPLIGINQGRLGFMTDVRFKEYRATLSAMLNGHYERDHRALINACVWRSGEVVFETEAMNDVVVNRTSAGMVELKIEVGGRFVAKQRADGLIIATPTGSTAYALSAGGPLIHPSIDGWVMVPIAPHTLSNRPIVLSCLEEVSVEIVSGRGVSANFDMQTITSLMKGDCVKVTQSAHRLTLLHPSGWSHFDTLRKKLHWNEDATGMNE